MPIATSPFLLIKACNNILLFIHCRGGTEIKKQQIRKTLIRKVKLLYNALHTDTQRIKIS